MEAAVELPLWLRALEPLSVPFVILLMLAGWLLEAKRDRERRRRHDARMRANAYELAELLNDWLSNWPEWGFAGERAPRRQAVLFARTIAEDGSAARELARGLVEDAPAATDPLAEVAREVFPRVVSLVGFMEGFAGADEGATASEEFERSLAVEFGTYWEEFLARAFNLLNAEIEDLRDHFRW